MDSYQAAGSCASCFDQLVCGDALPLAYARGSVRSRDVWGEIQAQQKHHAVAVLGMYGPGNIGQSAAVFLGPVIPARVGMGRVYEGVAAL
jgi:hypothetical protein